MRITNVKRSKMKLLMYTKAPCLWTFEEWKMTNEERESVGIKLVEVELELIENEYRNEKNNSKCNNRRNTC